MKKDSLVEVIKDRTKGRKKNIWLMRQAGRYLPEYHKVMQKSDNFISLCYTPNLVEELTLQPIKRFDLDAAIIFSDILVVADALGFDVEFIKGFGPKIHPINNYLALKSEEEALERLLPIFEAVKSVRKNLQKEKALIGFAGGPWTVASYIIEGGSSKQLLQTKKMCYTDKYNFEFIMERLVDITTAYLMKKIESGADIIQLFESNAGLLTGDVFDKWIIEPTREIVSSIRSKYPKFPIIGFPRNAGLFYKKYAMQTGISAISVDYSMPINWIKDNIELPIQGNLDPYLLAYDKTGAIEQARKIMDCFADKPFIFNLGHGIIPDTPVEHVEELVKFVNNY
ncbi:uroporphyrinogen decarboxylase [Candidatus Mesenet endosymbiont of Agriotes lineatus]|uniref:uroporphyrinogen decarboxylase n=1 Tax=Candidatus Mesenet endosymbiont of Agriotes lineatus TaxID=3077948 RepID=UPI0030D011AC